MEGQSANTIVEDPAIITADTPDWFNFPLVNIQSGESFSINALQGKVVLVEMLAMWCSNCLKQQQQVKALHTLLGDKEDFVSIGLDVDINERAADLIAYTSNNGFDWTYAIASAELSREISNLYGAQFLNPPSTPVLVIDRTGEVHLMPFGLKNAEELLDFIQPFLSDSL